MDNKQKVNPLELPVFCLNGKSCAYLWFWDNKWCGLVPLKETQDNEFTYSLN
jgi:hypothetical protein